jgi:glycosyltransferase involved in cell wall biosynthesis
MQKIIFAMPIFNEAECIEEFINEISEFTKDWLSVAFICIDDHSSDDTATVLSQLSSELNLSFITNEKNMGHGPSTLIALRRSLAEDCDYIVALDGDGQISGKDLSLMIEYALGNSELDIVEGVRKSRIDPAYRKVVSSFTRIMVEKRSRIKPKDANTPFRVYKPLVLNRLLNHVPNNSSIPNLHISNISRILQLNFAEIEVSSLPRRGSSPIGTMWRSKNVMLPSKRFIKFCVSSILEWVLTKPPVSPK